MTWRTFWALVLIVLGVVFLLINLEILPGQSWNYIFPTILVLLGLGLLLGWRGSTRELETVTESAPLEGATHSTVLLKHGAGRLSVNAGTDPGVLFSGRFAGGVDKSVAVRNGTANVELKTPRGIWENMGFPGTHGLTWELALNPSVPTAIRYEGGAAETKMDLSGMQLSSLDINTGASSTDVVLPKPNGTMRVAVHSGAASVKVFLPQDVPASIRGTMGLGSLDIDMTRFPGRGNNLYESDTFASAPDRIEMVVEGGVGSVQVR